LAKSARATVEREVSAATGEASADTKARRRVRNLGIPTALDRFVQQAMLQVLQRRWDKTFSEHNYGFRPNRSAHQAVVRAQQYMADGHRWVVDLDLEQFFDRVNHDKLMGRMAKRVADKRVLKLTRAFLNAGVMESGLVSPTDEGTPQGGPLSPLLSNLVLDELDRELEQRGHRFVRYADDCNIYDARWEGRSGDAPPYPDCAHGLSSRTRVGVNRILVVAGLAT
jgi:group II intron reverse transcriptase/maturase